MLVEYSNKLNCLIQSQCNMCYEEECVTLLDIVDI